MIINKILIIHGFATTDRNSFKQMSGYRIYGIKCLNKHKNHSYDGNSIKQIFLGYIIKKHAHQDNKTYLKECIITLQRRYLKYNSKCTKECHGTNKSKKNIQAFSLDHWLTSLSIFHNYNYK